MAAWLARVRERPFRLLHIAWAAFVLLVCAFLVVASRDGGHPPPLAFVPHALAAGVAGHLLLAAVGWLAGRGRARVAEGAAPWPMELTLVAIAVGVAALVSAAYAIESWTLVRTRPWEWLAVAAIAAVLGAAFVLLLLRRPVARFLLAAISVGWAIALGLEIGTARGPGERVLGVLVMALLAALAVYLVRAARVRGALR